MIGSQFGTKRCKFVTEKHTSHISFDKSGMEAMTRIRNSITSNLSEQSSNSIQIISRHVSKWRAWKIRWNIRRGKLSQKSIKLSQNLQRLREIFRDTKSGKWTLIWIEAIKWSVSVTTAVLGLGSPQFVQFFPWPITMMRRKCRRGKNWHPNQTSHQSIPWIFLLLLLESEIY